MYFYFNSAVLSKAGNPLPPARVIIAGPRQSTIQTSEFGTSELARQGLGLWLGRRLAPDAFGGNGRPLSIISGHANGSDQSGEALARHLAIPAIVMPAMWGAIDPSTGRQYGRSAGQARNHEMHKVATGLIATLPEWNGPVIKKTGKNTGDFIFTEPNGQRLPIRLNSMIDVNNLASHLIKTLGYHYDDTVHALDMALRYGPGFDDGTHGIEGLDQFKDELLKKFPLSERRGDVPKGEHASVLGSESTGTRDMVERAAGLRPAFSGENITPIPSIVFFMSHTRGGGRLQYITYSGEDGKRHIVYDADEPVSEEKSAEMGAPTQDEIEDRLQRIHEHFSSPEEGILRNPREGRYEWIPPRSLPGSGDATKYKTEAEAIIPEHENYEKFPHGIGPDFEGIHGPAQSTHLVFWPDTDPRASQESSVDYRGTTAIHEATAWRPDGRGGWMIPEHQPLDSFVKSSPSKVRVIPEHPFPKMIQTVVNRHVVLGDDSDPAEKVHAAIAMAKNHS